MTRVDMSSRAVSRRLEQVDELREACVSLAGSRLKRPWGVPESNSHHTRLAKETRATYLEKDKRDKDQ